MRLIPAILVLACHTIAAKEREESIPEAKLQVRYEEMLWQVFARNEQHDDWQTHLSLWKAAERSTWTIMSHRKPSSSLDELADQFAFRVFGYLPAPTPSTRGELEFLGKKAIMMRCTRDGSSAYPQRLAIVVFFVGDVGWGIAYRNGDPSGRGREPSIQDMLAVVR